MLYLYVCNVVFDSRVQKEKKIQVVLIEYIIEDTNGHDRIHNAIGLIICNIYTGIYKEIHCMIYICVPVYLNVNKQNMIVIKCTVLFIFELYF